MTSYVALYRGESVGDAKLIGVTSNPEVVSFVATDLLSDEYYPATDTDDPVLSAFDRGRRHALQLIRGGRSDE